MGISAFISMITNKIVLYNANTSNKLINKFNIWYNIIVNKNPCSLYRNYIMIFVIWIVWCNRIVNRSNFI
jgi:hypothetical protein